MVPPDSDRAPPTPPYSGSSLGSSMFRVRGCHPLRPAFPGVFPYMLFFHIGCPTTPRAPRRPRFGLAPFRSPLLGGSLLFSSPPSPRAAGCPIRKPADQGPLAPPRRISPPAASFIASGSHRHPPCALHRLPPQRPPAMHPSRKHGGARRVSASPSIRPDEKGVLLSNCLLEPSRVPIALLCFVSKTDRSASVFLP